MKKLILFLFLLSGPLYSQDFSSNKAFSAYLKLEKENLVWMNEYGREISKLKLPDNESISKMLLNETGDRAILQSKTGSVFYADLELKKITSLEVKLYDPITSLSEMNKESFLIGTGSGTVKKLRIENKMFKKVGALENLIGSSGIPVKEIQFSQNKDMFYVLHQKEAVEPIGFKYENTLPKDIQTQKHRAIGFHERDLSPSGFHKLNLGYGDSPSVTNIELFKAQEQNYLARLKQNSQQLSIFKFNKEAKLQGVFQTNNFTTMWMSENFDQMLLSSNLESEARVFNFRDILKNGEKEEFIKLIPNKHYDFIESRNGKLIMANADSPNISFYDLKTKALTEMQRESNVRGILNAYDGKYIVLENGKVELLVMNDKYVLFNDLYEPGQKFARNLKPKRFASKIFVLDSTGLSKELYLPVSCRGVF